MRTLAGLIMVIALIAPDLFAQQAQRALLPVKVNEVSRGEVFAYVSGDDVLVPKSFFDSLNVTLEAGTRQELDGETYVSLKSLAPNVTFSLNVEDLTLSMTIDPRLLTRQVLDLKRRVGPQEHGGDASMFFNYALSGDRKSTPNAFSEIGASRGHNLLYTGLSRANGALTRGLTFLNVDQPDNARRFTFGDAIVGNDLLGGAVTLAGVTMSREYTLQPYFIRSPGVELSGTALTPSTVEVYVNGQLINRIEVGPGVFTLRDIPATSGLGSTRLVIRDAFGRQTVQGGSFYYSATALKKDLSEYIFTAGAIRTNLSRSFDYAGPAALAQYRRGFTDHLTLGGRAEASKDVVSGGPRATMSTRFGDLDLNVAASRASGTSGTAGSAAYQYVTRFYSFGATALKRSNNYSTLSLKPGENRVTSDISAFVAVPVSRVSVGLTAGKSEMRDGDHTQQFALTATTQVSRWGTLFTSLGRVKHNGKTQPAILVGFTMSLGPLTTAGATYINQNGQSGVNLDVRRPLSLSNGYGYSLTNDTISGSRLASLQYQTSYGRYELNADTRHPDNASYLASGGLVYIGESLLPTRPIQESYALARVGVPDVTVFESNQPVGRTNGHGDLLLTRLLPYYANELRISDKDVPMDYEVVSTDVTVVPPVRGGVVAKFPVHRIHSYTGAMRFMIVGSAFTPGLGEVEVKGKDAKPTLLSLGRNGEFYVEDLDPGNYQATLRIGKVHCDFRLNLPPSASPVTDVGVIPCAP